MRDRAAVLWTRVGGQPLKMGRLYVTEREARFTYEESYLETGLPGLGLVYAPAIYGRATIRRTRSEYFDLHPPLQALIPPRSEGNFLRQLILKYLEKRNLRPAPGFDSDWAILTHAGHGGIGHLDVFADDEQAIHWYGTPRRGEWYRVEEGFGLSLKEFLTWFDGDAAPLLDIIGPTPTVGGAIPKLLLSIPREGWDGRIALPARHGEGDRLDVLLKVEKTDAYPGITALEALALEVHREAGFAVPRHWQVEINGVPALVVERFDRGADGVPRPVESLYSILASGSRAVTHHYSASYDVIGRALDNVEVPLVSEKSAAKEYLLRRLLLALLTGNGDLHLENLALLRRGEEVAFSPVYDPTPMRAYRRHDLLVAMPFGGYGELLPGRDEPVGFAEACEALRKGLGVRPPRWHALLEEALAVTREYPERVGRLAAVPEPNREQLQKVHRAVRERIAALL